MNCQQPFQQRLEQLQIQRIGSVGFGVGRVVMDFEKQPINARCHRSPRQYKAREQAVCSSKALPYVNASFPFSCVLTVILMRFLEWWT